jgi:hypothetical protein
MALNMHILMADAFRQRTPRATTKDSAVPGSGMTTHPKFRMWLRPDGIVHLVVAPRTRVLLEDAAAVVEAMARLTGGRRTPLLVNLMGAGPQDRAARTEFVRRNDLVSAAALIVDTPLSRMVGNLAISASKPTTPTRLFDNEASALGWLRQFVG